MNLIANKYYISHGVGISGSALPSFDKALLDAGVGNYNLVRLSSILPARCERVDKIDLTEGSLLPTAYATISSNEAGDFLVSAIGVGIPENESHVGVIMEYSTKNVGVEKTMQTLYDMITEAFDERDWKLKEINADCACARVRDGSKTYTTFACIAEW